MLYADPLTGEPLAEPSKTRLFAVTINNVPKALPHVGTNQAGLYFEMFINDYATRGLALYSDVRKVDVIGSVRSWRYNFTDLAIAYDAYGAHAGGSKQVLNDAWRNGTEHINIQNASGVSFRDQARRSTGYSLEHTLMARGPELYAFAEKEGIRVQHEGEKTYGLNFVEDGTPANGEAAGLINITFNHLGHKKLTTMTYDESLGKYVYTQYGKGIDSVKESSREAFENVFVILTTVTNKDVYHVADLDCGGEGYYACGGKIVKILWHHDNPTDPITFTLEDGTPLTQGIGNSYIGICPLKSEVVWE